MWFRSILLILGDSASEERSIKSLDASCVVASAFANPAPTPARREARWTLAFEGKAGVWWKRRN